MSFGRQPPPKPSPASRKRRPIRASCPSASARVDTSAPAAVAELGDRVDERDLRREERVRAHLHELGGGQIARRGRGRLSRSAPRTPARIAVSAAGDAPPMTTRSGCSVSSTALPSRRNSGFQISSAEMPSGARAPSSSRSRAAVPTGTVDLPTTMPVVAERARDARDRALDEAQVGAHGWSPAAGCRRRRSGCRSSRPPRRGRS